MGIETPVVTPHEHQGMGGTPTKSPPAAHAGTHEGGSDPVTPAGIGAAAVNHNQAAETITSGTLDGDRLPAISATKRGGVPAVGVPDIDYVKYLMDYSGEFERIIQADIDGLMAINAPQFSGLGIKTAGSDNAINLIEGAQIGVATGPRLVFRDANKLLELLDADINIGNIPTILGTGGTWTTSYDSTESYLYRSIVFQGKLYVGSAWGFSKIYVYDSSTWVLAVTLGTGVFSFCVHNNKLFVGGSNGKVYVTSDGVSWPETAADLAGKLNSIDSLLSDGAILWAGGSQYGGPVYYTIDEGATWTLTLAPSPAGYYAKGLISFLGNRYVGITESSSDVLRSWIYKWNGASWSTVHTDAGPQSFRASIVWNNKLYFGGTVGRIYVCNDGDNFSLAVDLSEAGSIQGFVEYNAKLLVACGSKIYETSDGVIWTEFYGSAEAVIYDLILFGNDIYAATGTAGKVLAYIDNTYVPAPNLQVFGHYTLWGQFRPGNAAGTEGDLLISGGASHPIWLARGIDGEYIAGVTGGKPVWAELNQAAVAGLTETDGPTFAHLHITDLAAITTAAESWIGPSAAAGIYFKGGFSGFGTAMPVAPLHAVGAAFPVNKVTRQTTQTGGPASSCLLHTERTGNNPTVGSGGGIVFSISGSTLAETNIARLCGIIDDVINTYGALEFDTTGADGSLVERMRISSGGNIGMGGIKDPTARLHLPACVAAANLASLKIDPGILATTPANGNIESDGTHLYWTDFGGTRRQLDN